MKDKLNKKNIDKEYYFIIGYTYFMAKKLKSELKCYEDWTISDIMTELFENI